MVGQTVSHYRILQKLGEGGMGVVYKAEDTKLRRTVALKFLPPTNSENRERFLREAQAAASLNHPNICTVFEIDEEHGFIAMELIDGVSVKDKITARPLPLEEALDIAMQTCAGLAAAHEKGIVHRDIKPANLMVTAQGQVKIMDFGLAQVGDRTRITKTGSSLGTPAYMSPEQAKGDAADRRTDIWSLGVVLYEMLAGRLPFRGDTEQAVSYGIVHSAPEPLSALRTGLPVSLDRVAAKALSKDPEDRYQHAADLGVDLRSVHRDPVQLQRPTASHRIYVAVVLTLVVGLAAVWWMRRAERDDPQLPLRRFTLRFSAPTSATPDMRLVAVSPDGNQIAIIDREKRNTVWIQELNRQQPRMLEGTEGAITVFWSPDSSTIGFGSGFGALKRVAVKGGSPILLCERPPYISGATWSPDGGSIVFASGTPSSLYRVPASGGTPSHVVSPQMLTEKRKDRKSTRLNSSH